MQAFEPLINLICVLTVLSVVAERITNALKLRNPDMRMKKSDASEERQRELSISLHSVGVGVIVALAVKANFFELVAHLDEPWRTFGWVNVERFRWVQSPATSGFGPFVYTVVGCVFTGAALGFGSKFWHDILGTVYDIRNNVRARANGGSTEVATESRSSTEVPETTPKKRSRKRNDG